ncbi:MAG: hypothetical protein R3E44_08835 [Paracoccaceae bacterium]
MAKAPTVLALLAGSLAGLTACATEGRRDDARVYGGAAPVAMGDDLYGFLITMEGARDVDEVEAYVTCVVAGYTLEKNAGFARRVRTKVKEEGGVWIADAVYSISPALPRGLKTIDAEVTVADCAERGIPTARDMQV